jgi:hypothetical protein
MTLASVSAAEAEWGVKDRVFEILLVEVDEPDGGVRR